MSSAPENGKTPSGKISRWRASKSGIRQIPESAGSAGSNRNNGLERFVTTTVSPACTHLTKVSVSLRSCRSVAFFICPQYVHIFRSFKNNFKDFQRFPIPESVLSNILSFLRSPTPPVQNQFPVSFHLQCRFPDFPFPSVGSCEKIVSDPESGKGCRQACPRSVLMAKRISRMDKFNRNTAPSGKQFKNQVV